MQIPEGEPPLSLFFWSSSSANSKADLLQRVINYHCAVAGENNNNNTTKVSELKCIQTMRTHPPAIETLLITQQ